MNYERENIRAMQGYVSGEQPETTGVIKLNTNENPYPASPMAARALQDISIDEVRRYPPPTAKPLRDALSSLNELDSENIIVTNGGDELLRLAFSTFIESEDTIAVVEPTYTLYTVLAEAHGCKIARMQMTAEWTLPEDLAEQLNGVQAKLCFIPNPHAPSGKLCSPEQIRQLAEEFNGIVFLDEAYIDFVDPELSYSSSELVRQYDNILVLRTFSKGYSLAGLRMAYGMGSLALIEPMQYKTKDSYNTDFIAQKIALAAVSDQQYANTTWAQVRSERSRLSSNLEALGFSCIPSQSNFILATVPENCDAGKIYRALKDRDILVRYFNQDRLQDKLRITIGRQEENQALIQNLTDILAGH